MKPIKKSFFRHSGLPSSAVAMLRRVDDPESRKFLKTLDPPVKPGDDDITTLVTFRKDLFRIPIYNEKLYYSVFIPALKSGVFC